MIDVNLNIIKESDERDFQQTKEVNRLTKELDALKNIQGYLQITAESLAEVQEENKKLMKENNAFKAASKANPKWQKNSNFSVKNKFWYRPKPINLEKLVLVKRGDKIPEHEIEGNNDIISAHQNPKDQIITMEEIDTEMSAVESISDTLVYNHLKKLGCTNTAKRLLRIRNLPEFPELQGIPRLEYLLNDYQSYPIGQNFTPVSPNNDNSDISTDPQDQTVFIPNSNYNF